MGLEEMLNDSVNILLLDNLNVDLKTFDPYFFQTIMDNLDKLGIDRIVNLGNLYSNLDDYVSYGKNRSRTRSEWKRIVEDSNDEFGGRKLYELDDKIKYVNQLFSEIDVPVHYTLGSHDLQIIRDRADVVVSTIVNSFEQNQINMLKQLSGQVDFITPYILDNVDLISEKKEELSDKQFYKWLRKNAKAYAKEFFGSEPVEKMTSKSDMSPDVVDNIFLDEKMKYMKQLEKTGLIIQDSIWDIILEDNHIRFGYDLSGLARPSVNGFGSMKYAAKQELAFEGSLPDILVQGRHGVGQFGALRHGDHEYAYLIQVPAFERRDKGLKLNKFRTANFEPPMRQSKVPVPEGVMILNLYKKGGIGYTWIDKHDFESNLERKLVSKASIQDVQSGHGQTMHHIFENALKHILKNNPNYLNLGGDLIQGGHYWSYNYEKTLPNAEQIEKDTEGLNKEERRRYFKSYNIPYHRQKNYLNNTLMDFVTKYVSLPGDKTIFLNDGHHSRLMTKDFKLSYNQELAQQIINNMEFITKMEGRIGEYNELIAGLEYSTSFNGNNYRVKFQDNELIDSINGVGFSRTHTRRASGGTKFSQLKGILNWIAQRQPQHKLIEVEHFHDLEGGIAYGKEGSFITILHPAFQDTTEYAEGHMASRGSFADSILGYVQMWIGEGIYRIKPVLSDVLK